MLVLCGVGVNGTSHHIRPHHVSFPTRKAGRLLEATEEYLTGAGYDYAHGKDGAGHVGAVCVYQFR